MFLIRPATIPRVPPGTAVISRNHRQSIRERRRPPRGEAVRLGRLGRWHASGRQKEYLKPEHELVVDTGFIPEKGGRPVGDVEESARSIPRYITAVPGGTGPIEMAVLMERAAKLLGIKVRTWKVELRDGKLRAVFVE
jgi:hypothetical protein